VRTEYKPARRFDETRSAVRADLAIQNRGHGRTTQESRAKPAGKGNRYQLESRQLGANDAAQIKWLWANGYPVPGVAAPVEANALIRKRRAPSPEQEHAHRLAYEGYLSQAEIARKIERLFHTPFTQSQVSRAVKRVDDWLQAVETNPPVRRAKRTAAVDPRRNEPNPRASGGGRRVIRKLVGD
jgi:hypothetical protein